jgi:predicted phosphate transport protein (TIGR00153 family)
MSNWLRNYFPSRVTFARLFQQNCENLLEMSSLLLSGLEADSAGQREDLFKKVDRLEEKGDDFTHKIYLELEKTLFPPINRKHIHILAAVMDDIADQIQEATGRIQLYNLESVYAPMADIAAYIWQSVTEIKTLILSVFNIKDVQSMRLTCKSIKQFEHETDLIYYRALASLFQHEKDPITVLKYRDILYSLETAVNKCKATADAIETILINRV